MGKSKVLPKHGHTIPRLELCSAVMAAGLAEVVSEHLNVQVETMKFHSDSRVVLGYSYNRVRRFYVYVENQVNKILKCTRPDQWSYICSKDNPADLGTGPTPVESIPESIWMKRPGFLLTKDTLTEASFELQKKKKIQKSVLKLV